MEKQLKNRQLVAILNGLHDEGGRALLSKRLPAAVVFALRRNITWVESAYRDYHTALSAICRAHGTAVEDIGKVTDPALAHEVAELLDAETSVSVQAVSLDALSRCGDGGYDALSVADLDRLDWMLEEGSPAG